MVRVNSPRGERGDRTDGNPTQIAGLQRHQFFAHAAEFGEHHAGVIGDGFPERGSAHAPRQTFEELDAQQVLGFMEHLGCGGLGHADVVSGAAQRTEFLQREHQPQLAQTQSTVDHIGFWNSGHGLDSQKRLRQA